MQTQIGRNKKTKIENRMGGYAMTQNTNDKSDTPVSIQSLYLNRA